MGEHITDINPHYTHPGRLPACYTPFYTPREATRLLYLSLHTQGGYPPVIPLLYTPGRLPACYTPICTPGRLPACYTPVTHPACLPACIYTCYTPSMPPCFPIPGLYLRVVYPAG